MSFEKRYVLGAATMAAVTFFGWNPNVAMAAQYRAADVQAEVQMLTKEDHESRMSAVTRLGEMGTEAKSAVPQLIELLQNDPVFSIRGDCAKTLGNIGPDAVSAVPALIGFLKNTECGYERAYAPTALGNIGLLPEQSVPALVEALQNDPDPVVRQLSARALADFGANAGPAIPALIDALKNGKKDLRDAAVCGLEKIPARHSDVTALSPLLDDEVDDVRAAAAVSIGGAGSEAVAVVPKLVTMLKDKDVKVRQCAAKGLGQIGSEAKTAIPALKLALRDADLKWDASQALAQIRGK
jgi:HEAT repeat protein